jgi:tetratricopeptide (TPR) repeat protein
MNRSLIRAVCSVSLALACIAAPVPSCGQTVPSHVAPSIEGKVCDGQNYPIADATVILENVTTKQLISVVTDAKGHFQFSGLTAGTYTLRAKLRDFADTVERPFQLGEHDSKSVVLLLQKAPLPRSSKSDSAEIPFSDEPRFTVAGVTDTTSLGGHGSDPVRRNSDVLSKDAVRLSSATGSAPDEATIRGRLADKDDADLRFELAELEESSGHSLDAVNDYQRAAQMAPTEPHLFAWGAELLLHRAFDPSIEVFTRGRRLFPDSTRMALGLGAATYAKGASEEAKQIFLLACDIAPSDPTPYLFLGRVQVTETELPVGWTDRLKRFVDIEPGNAQAHYFYAVALTKTSAGPADLRLATSQLQTTVALDPHFGDAYLQLGILASQQGDLPAAVTDLQKAVENTALPDDAHYRLAQVYRRMGETEKARQESELYKQASEKKNQQVEQERHELQQFVYTLREQAPSSPKPSSPK